MRKTVLAAARRFPEQGTGLMTAKTKSRLRRHLKEAALGIEESLLRIGEAGGTCDWHDNFALDQANRDYDLFRSREIILKQKLARAKIIISRPDTNVVGLGNRVTVYFRKERKARTLTIVGPEDSGYLPNWISYLSPMGKKLMGGKVGYSFHLKIEGRSRWFTILEILPGEF